MEEKMGVQWYRKKNTNDRTLTFIDMYNKIKSFRFNSFLYGNVKSEPKKLENIKGGIIKMPNNQDNRNKNSNPNRSVNDAGHNGGEATSNNQDYKFYEELGRKGGEARKRPIEIDDSVFEEAERENKQRDADKYNL